MAAFRSRTPDESTSGMGAAHQKPTTALMQVSVDDPVELVLAEDANDELNRH
jgi:hypothetical protein